MPEQEIAKIFRQADGAYSYTVGTLPPGTKFIIAMPISATQPERRSDLDHLYRRVVNLNLGWRSKIHRRLHDLRTSRHRIQAAAVGVASFIFKRLT